MADETLRRWLVKWTERVTHTDIAYVSEEQVRLAVGLDEEHWAELDEVTRASMTRYHLNRLAGVDELGGTRRYKVKDRTGFDVLDSAPWAEDAPEPGL